VHDVEAAHVITVSLLQLSKCEGVIGLPWLLTCLQPCESPSTEYSSNLWRSLAHNAFHCAQAQT
jgi:hypothetical protein